jgi:hypothetical protein
MPSTTSSSTSPTRAITAAHSRRSTASRSPPSANSPPSSSATTPTAASRPPTTSSSSRTRVIDAYVARHAARHQAAAPGARPATDGYVSPRTKAACRDVLNASALLHHRDHVEKSDLAALRFVLTIIPGNDRALHDPGQDIFAEALHSTLQGYTEADLETVRELTAIAESFHLYLHGIPIEAQPAHRGLIRFVLALIGKSSWHDVTAETFLEALRGRTIANPRVNALREEILEEVQEYAGG